MQAQIFDDINSPSEWKTRHPVFDQSPLLPPEFGGHIDILPDDVLFRESQNDEELRKQLSGGAVPAVDTIYR